MDVECDVCGQNFEICGFDALELEACHGGDLKRLCSRCSSDQYDDYDD